MTLNGAIMQLVEMRENSMMPEVFKPYFDKVIETVSECEEPSTMSERKKGKWIPHREKSREYIGTTLIHVTYDYWLCDTCGYRVENGRPMYNFCPNCGADMRGEQDGRSL